MADAPLPQESPRPLRRRFFWPGGLSAHLLVLTNLITLGLMVFMGLRGNELIAKHLLSRGWQFVDPTSDAVRYARMEWKIAENSAATSVTPLAS